MPIVVEQSNGNFESMPEGLHLATFAEIKDLGEVTNQYGTKRVIVARLKNDAGQEASRFYTPSLHEKSKLAKDLTAMYGSVPKSFDIESLVGQKVQLFVTNYVDGKGRTKAKIEKVMKAPGTTAKTVSAKQAPTTRVQPTDLGFAVTDDDIPF
jgi:hypothetical protein